MKKKIILFLITAALFSISCVNSIVYAYSDEISNENMEKAVSAYKHGISMLRAKAYDSAIEAFQTAVDYYPKMTDAYYNMAGAYAAQKKYDDAYNIYVKIIALNPNDYDAILQAAKISYNRKNYSLTLKYLKYIPYDYEKYNIVHQLYKDAKEQFDSQIGKIERSKISSADKAKKVLIDKFNSPAGMAVDSEGNIFVACYSDNAVVKVDKQHNKSNFVKDYLLDGPVGLAIDTYDNIYVANFDANNILKITKGGNVSVFMDKISKPYFLYIKDDVLYISEQGNDVVLTYNLAK